MSSPESRQIRATLGQPLDTLDRPLDVERAEWDAAAAQIVLPPEIVVTPADVAGLYGEWISCPDADPQRTLLYLHGGGYNAGSCVTHRDLAARLCVASGIWVLLIDYRLAPEHPFPAAVDDVVAAYSWLLESGTLPQQIVIGGDSSGAGLALSVLLRLREQGLPQPAACALISPWADLSLAGETIQTHAALDPLVSEEGLRRAAHWYLGDADPALPLASPVYADLHGLPPMLIQVGSDEILLSDATRLAARARAAGVQVRLDIWDELWHVWHAWAAVLPEGDQAIARIGAFVREALQLPEPLSHCTFA